MKKLMSVKAIALAILLITGLHSFAQEKADKRPGMEASQEKREQRFAEASKRLSLTADQESKIKAIMQQNRTDMKALREANKEKAKEEKRKAMMGQMQKTDGQINAVLDPKQQEIYKQMKTEKKEQMEKRRAENMKKEDEMGDYGGGIF